MKIDLDRLHTTELGIVRIKRNLNIKTYDVVEYIKSIIANNNCKIYIKGKNIYCEVEKIIITINKKSYTIITAHMIK